MRRARKRRNLPSLALMATDVQRIHTAGDWSTSRLVASIGEPREGGRHRMKTEPARLGRVPCLEAYIGGGAGRRKCVF